MTTAQETKPEAPESAQPLAFGSTVGLGPLPARWYCVSNDGMATLCKDQEDAQANARHCDLAWPKGAPHRAVMLGDVGAEHDRCATLLSQVAVMGWREGAADERERWRQALERLADALEARLGTNAAEWADVRQARALLGRA